jgi:universal stress protein E
MPEQQRILVVVDPTGGVYPAIERAAWLAHHLSARIELFVSDHTAQVGDSRAAVLERHRRRLDQLAEPLRQAGLTVECDVRWDYPLHDSIVRKSVDFGADLVVKDTHYHSALQRSIFSNTDWSLIRGCAAALWLVKPRPPGQRPCFIAAVDPLHERDKPADLDQRILTTATAFSRALGGEVHVFHAFDLSSAIALSTDSLTVPMGLPINDFADAMRAEHAEAVANLCKTNGVPPGRTHVHQGSTRQLLMTLTEQLRADAVFMGAISRSGLKGLFLGNTAEDVLDRLHCDLVIVKPEGFAAALPS